MVLASIPASTAIASRRQSWASSRVDMRGENNILNGILTDLDQLQRNRIITPRKPGVKSFSQGDATPLFNFKPSFKLRFACKRFVLFCAKRYVSRISVFVIGLTLSSAIYAEGDLQTIRDDVRGLTPNTPQPASTPPPASANKNPQLPRNSATSKIIPTANPRLAITRPIVFRIA